MFSYTRHALEKMDGLGVDKSNVERTIMQGMKWKEESEQKWHAQMAGLEIVFMKEEEKIVIITAYLAGRPK
jgi:hypothetical protein